MAELRQLAGDGNLSDAIRELIHAQYAAKLYAQATRDAERLRNDPADLAEIRAVNEELDEIQKFHFLVKKQDPKAQARARKTHKVYIEAATAFRASEEGILGRPGEKGEP